MLNAVTFSGTSHTPSSRFSSHDPRSHSTVLSIHERDIYRRKAQISMASPSPSSSSPLPSPPSLTLFAPCFSLTAITGPLLKYGDVNCVISPAESPGIGINLAVRGLHPNRQDRAAISMSKSSITAFDVSPGIGTVYERTQSSS